MTTTTDIKKQDTRKEAVDLDPIISKLIREHLKDLERYGVLATTAKRQARIGDHMFDTLFPLSEKQLTAIEKILHII